MLSDSAEIQHLHLQRSSQDHATVVMEVEKQQISNEV